MNNNNPLQNFKALFKKYSEYDKMYRQKIGMIKEFNNQYMSNFEEFVDAWRILNVIAQVFDYLTTIKFHTLNPSQAKIQKTLKKKIFKRLIPHMETIIRMIYGNTYKEQIGSAQVDIETIKVMVTQMEEENDGFARMHINYKKAKKTYHKWNRIYDQYVYFLIDQLYIKESNPPDSEIVVLQNRLSLTMSHLEEIIETKKNLHIEYNNLKTQYETYLEQNTGSSSSVFKEFNTKQFNNIVHQIKLIADADYESQYFNYFKMIGKMTLCDWSEVIDENSEQ